MHQQKFIDSYFIKYKWKTTATARKTTVKLGLHQTQIDTTAAIAATITTAAAAISNK